MFNFLFSLNGRRKLKMFSLLSFFLILFSLSLVSAKYSDCSIYGTCKPSTGTTYINNSYTTNNNNYYNGTSYNVSYDAGIKWQYNQTTLTTGSYNSTYDKYAYNMSDNFNYNQTYLLGTYNVTYNKYAYNMSDGSYNVTYDSGIRWFYNMTLPFTNWLSNFNYNYNQTYVSTGTYNSTYDKYAYNQTTLSTGTYNSTYDKWSYNQTYTSTGTYNATYNALNSTYGSLWLNWTNQLPLWIRNVNFTNSSSSSITTNITASGGTITFVGGYEIHTFTSNGSFNLNNMTNVEVLVVAGGGGGGGSSTSDQDGGGGGAGGLLYNASYFVNGNISVTVGAGGLGIRGTGNNGANSSFGNMIANGGGGGGKSPYNDANFNPNGTSGGSGGGGGQWDGIGGHQHSYGGAGTNGQGYIGGNQSGDAGGAGGGGGAGFGGYNSTGTNPTSRGGDGGNGTSFLINGTNVTYAGGGAGAGYNTGGKGGLGGGGNGGAGSGGSATPTNGTNGLGGGGGGGGRNIAGGNGGSGVVIIRFPSNYTTIATTLTNTTIDFGDNVLLAKGFNVHSDIYTGDALTLIQGMKEELPIKSGTNLSEIDHSTIGECMEIRNEVVTERLDCMIGVFIKGIQQVTDRVLIIETENKDIKTCIADSKDYAELQVCVGKI